MPGGRSRVTADAVRAARTPRRRIGLVSIVVAAVTAAFVGARAVPSHAAVVPTPWRFAGIGVSQSTLRIATLGGGCDRPTASLAEETASSVRIVARNMRPDVDGPCTADIRISTLYVRLSSPLAGRALLGGDSTEPHLSFGASSIPRVVGLAPGDALAVLRAAGVSPKIIRRQRGAGLRRVVAQSGSRLVVAGGQGAAAAAVTSPP